MFLRNALHVNILVCGIQQCFVPYFLNDAWNACFCQVEMALGTFKEMLQQK